MPYRNTTHYISVANGEDVCSKLRLYANTKQQEINVLYANGSLSKVTFKRDEMYEHKGRFTIVSLRGSQKEVMVVLIDENGHALRGFVSRGLIAEGDVNVMINIFSYENSEDSASETNSSGSAESVSISYTQSTESD